MEPGSVVRAVFEFLPSVSEELPLFTGDVIEVLSVVDEFWLLGNKDGVTGQFPSTFVEPVSIPSAKPGERLYVCINDFSSLEPGNLALKRGDVVVGEGNVDAAWLRGRNCWGSRGVIPVSCVEELRLSCRSRQLSQKAAVTAAATSDLPSHALGQARALMGLSAQLEEELDFREDDIITIVGEAGPYDIYEEEEEEEEGREGSARAAEESVEEEEEDEEGVYGVALYDFRAMEAGELDFDVGDRIRVVSTLEDGWLEGRLRGRSGVFPHRFVRLEPAPRPDAEREEPPNFDSAPSIENIDEDTGRQSPALPGDSHGDGHGWSVQEDHTVWDLDYLEHRAERGGADRKWAGAKPADARAAPATRTLSLASANQNGQSDGRNVAPDNPSGWGERRSHRKVARHSSVNDSDLLLGRAGERWGKPRGRSSNGLSGSFTLESLSASARDLDAELCQQLAEETEGPAAPPPRPRVVRPRVSRGSPAGGDRGGPQSFRPARPAPRPPPPCLRPDSHSPRPQTDHTFPAPEDEEQEEADPEAEAEAESDEQKALEREQEQYSLLRLQEVERDMEVYSQTMEELRLMLEEEEDETARAQALENLEFCSYTLDTLSLEQQQLRGERPPAPLH
ncbi:hypothetical protein ANANG_G00046000 [Anguilla anguilla]|uniref:SH3 domain-containing protein n=1 Tax=Anguilla anguilla TaxID=7936 RepID=A0A9D3MWR3_ANGAN|nr:hypothetical protein ANANG_G00046000 [Anguilla anguilla]